MHATQWADVSSEIPYLALDNFSVLGLASCRNFETFQFMG
jgi:hypothetical protein